MFSRKTPTIPEYFHGKNVFLTGGTGFLGKVLIEKLLRSCPGIGDINVLVRPKRGKTMKERRDDITEAQLFDIIRKENLQALDKIKCISGDVTELKLGISEEDEKMLTSKVDIIYHVAASVRFDDPLRKAILTNIRSTREIIQLALRCTKLETFMHVSTAYCNVDHNFIEERLYRTPVDWRDAIDLAESDKDLSAFTVKYMAPWPNTYTFTKRISEHVTKELCEDKIPSIILRPSIIIAGGDSQSVHLIQRIIVARSFAVVHSDKEPMPGWIDNLNGPFGLIVAGMIGITATYFAKGSSLLDYVSVDNVVKGMLIATWEKGLSKDKSGSSIYNACSEIQWNLKFFEVIHTEVSKVVFYEKTIWNFDTRCTQCWYRYYFDTLFYVAITMTIDLLLKLQGMKPRVLKLVRTTFVAMEALSFFMTNTFVFNTLNFDQLDSKLVECDREAFMQSNRPRKSEDMFNFAVSGLRGVKYFKFKEREMSPEETAERSRRFRIMKYAFNYTFSAIIIYLILVTWIL